MEKSGKICFRMESIKIGAESINDLFKDLDKTKEIANKFSLNRIRNKVPCFETRPRISYSNTGCGVFKRGVQN